MPKETLNGGQRTRLRQLVLQRDGLFGPEWTLKELQITDEQRKRFRTPLKLRLDLEDQLEALLTDAQKKQCMEMRGKPVDLGVFFI